MQGLRIGALTVAVFTGLLLAVGPASGSVPTTGSQITLSLCIASPCESTYPAGQPFFVQHGFTNESRRFLLDPTTKFELSVDGAETSSTVDLDVTGPETHKLNLTNFRFGMTGVHTFVGCWYAQGVLVQCGTRIVSFTG